MNPYLKLLLDNNTRFIHDYKNSLLMQVIHSDQMQKKSSRIRMLDGIQVFSDYFQKVVMLRNVFCDDLKFIKVSNDHLKEEFGHNLSLLKDRDERPAVWDSILESTSCWFAWKMFTLNNEEKTVLVHFVLESSANIFFHAANKVMMKYQETDYFKIHAELDEVHEEMGKELLQNISPNQVDRLLLIQKQGWDVLNTTCDRIAQLTLQQLQ